MQEEIFNALLQETAQQLSRARAGTAASSRSASVGVPARPWPTAASRAIRIPGGVSIARAAGRQGLPALGILSAVLLTQTGCDELANEPASVPTYTWYKDVEPVVQRECRSCHFEGGIGPFPLDTWDQAKVQASSMAASVKSRSMPPWLPALESTCLPLQNPRVLTDAEIEMFQVWASEGAPKGDVHDARSYTSVVPKLEEVSLDKGPGEDYLPNASISDDYRCFVIDPEATQDEYVVGYDIQPGIPWLVHHVNVVIADADEALKLDRDDEGAGWNCIDSIGITKVAMVGAWAPGTLPILFPEDTGILLEKGRVLVTQVHYNTVNGNIEPDNTRVLLQYAHETPKEQAYIALLPNSGFEIPPNSVGYSSSFELELPFTARVWGVGGHMHQKGVWFKSEITRNNETTCMLYIDRWRYAWQQGYFYDMDQPFKVDVGDIVKVTCAWDNPTDRTITWAEGVEDEMCIGYFYITGLDENRPGL